MKTMHLFVMAFLFPLIAEGGELTKLPSPEQARLLENCCGIKRPNVQREYPFMPELKPRNPLQDFLSQRRFQVNIFDQHRPEGGRVFIGRVGKYGKVYGIVSSEGEQEYRGSMPMGGRMSVTDIRGKRLEFTYSTVNGCYWSAYTSNTYLHASMRVAHEGRIGRGLQQLGLSRAYLTRNRDSLIARTPQ